jgi:hypothetical protein
VPRPGRRHGQVVGGADHRQLADVTPRKFQRLHHIAIAAEGQAAVGQRQPGGIVQLRLRLAGAVAVEGQQLLADQLLHQAAAAAMGQQDAVGHGAKGAAR